MHNRRSTTTCFRLTMVALKQGFQLPYTYTLGLSLNHGRVETNPFKTIEKKIKRLSLNHGRVETRELSHLFHVFSVIA